MAIRTRAAVDSESLTFMAQKLEGIVSQRIIYVILRQKQEDPGKICFAMSSTQDLDGTISRMDSNGYTEGVAPIGPLIVHERQQFKISLKGNIKLRENATENHIMKMSFNSALLNEYKVSIFIHNALINCIFRLK